MCDGTCNDLLHPGMRKPLWLALVKSRGQHCNLPTWIAPIFATRPCSQNINQSRAHHAGPAHVHWGAPIPTSYVPLHPNACSSWT